MAGRRLGLWKGVSVLLVKPWVLALTRPDWRGADNVPREGGVILVANHLSHFDPLAIAHFVYGNGRWPHFLAKASLFDLPVLGRLMSAVEQIPVHRGTSDAAKALDCAVEAVRSGQAVIIYPEGTTTRDPDLWPMRGKTGVARLALATGAPVVPIVTWGPQQIFDPRTQSLRLRPRVPMTVVAGPPIDCAALIGGTAPAPDQTATSADLLRLTDGIMAVLTENLRLVRAEGRSGRERPETVAKPSHEGGTQS